MIRSTFILSIIYFLSGNIALGQDAGQLVQKAREKIEKVNDYQAKGRMRTNVSFLKVPVADIRIYFKRPDKLKIKSEKGISFFPKGAVSFQLNNILSGKYQVIDAGMEKLGNSQVRIIKLLPEDDNSDVVLSTLYIDESANLVRKARTTTRENGSFELELFYGKYADLGLPDKIIFSFNTKDYKLPKGVTFDFDDGSEVPQSTAVKNKKGRAEISISQYIINKGFPDSVFNK